MESESDLKSHGGMEVQISEQQGVRIAVEGCGHGTLHAIYASIDRACAVRGWPGVDLLIIGGDFQSVRNAADLHCVSMPARYREMHDFHEYYSGERTAPCLTIFVGGNHEASNYLFELFYGGWVAPNIYYMGAANVLRLGPLRIAGMSGIWKGFDYNRIHHERLPYNNDDVKSIYHVREFDVRKLLQIRTQVDIGISHDWPQGVVWQGDWQRLFRQKSFLEQDARTGRLGSLAAKHVMDRLRPPYWFSAHLHCKYAAIVNHEEADLTDGHAIHPAAASATEVNSQTGPVEAPAKNEDEIDLDVDLDTDDQPAQARPQASETPMPTASSAILPVNADEMDLELDEEEGGTSAVSVAPGQGLDGVKVPLEDSTAHAADQASAASSSTSMPTEDIRAQLPASFARPAQPEPRAPVHVTHPATITNTKTNFLALDKCLPHRDFLQLLSIPPTPSNPSDSQPGASDTPPTSLQRPLKLHYDPEWLAITRALNPDLIFSSNPSARSPPHKGESHYASLIDAAALWVTENITQKNNLAIPENFVRVAPVYNHALGLAGDGSGVREYPNPQTERFCALLGMENPLAIGEEEIHERMRVGPGPEAPRRDGGRGGHGRGGSGRGGGRGRGRGFGGRGGRGGGRGRGY